jgi:hypothetical protein
MKGGREMTVKGEGREEGRKNKGEGRIEYYNFRRRGERG